VVEARAVARIAVVGAGMLGSALCVTRSDAGHVVRPVETPLDDLSIAQLQATGQHPKLRPASPEPTHFHLSSALGSVLSPRSELGVEGAPSARPLEELVRT
jgi:glycerol-3-phosphate dehydrogenase (NAD(P)+)